jgi:hypothetical protein
MSAVPSRLVNLLLYIPTGGLLAWSWLSSGLFIVLNNTFMALGKMT